MGRQGREQEEDYLLVLKSDPISLVSADAGTYAVAVNANDIAAAGAVPRWLLATCLCPPGTIFPTVEKIFADLSAACRTSGISLVGGHMEISQSVRSTVLSCALAGEPLKRISARPLPKPGDALVLVKELGIEGASILAREKARQLKKAFPSLLARAEKAILNPGISVVREALLAWRRFPITAMHDPTEGGLSAAVHELAIRLKCGFLLQENGIRVFPPARSFAQFFKLDILGLISSGCLLIVLPKDDGEALVRFYARHKIKARIIGTVTKEPKVEILRKNGKRATLPYCTQDEITKVQ